MNERPITMVMAQASHLYNLIRDYIQIVITETLKEIVKYVILLGKPLLQDVRPRGFSS